MVLGEVLFGLPQAEIEVAKRAAAVAGDEAGGVQAGSQIELPLQHGQANQGLGAGQARPGCRVYLSSSVADSAAGKSGLPIFVSIYAALWAGSFSALAVRGW